MYNPAIMYKAIENSPYVGEVLMKRIMIHLDEPNEMGEVWDVADLDNVKGLGKKKREDLQFQYHKLVDWGW